MKPKITKKKIGLIGIGLTITLILAATLPFIINQLDMGLTRHPSESPHHLKGINQLKDEVRRLESKNASLEENDSNLQARIESHQQQLAALSQQLLEKSQTTTENDESRQTEHKLPEPSTVKNTPKDTVEAEMDQAEAQMEEQSTLLEDTLYQEEADPDWSMWAENELNQAFNKPDAEGLTLVDAQCQRTLCRIELSGEATTNVEEALIRLHELAPWEAHGFFEVSGIDDQEETPEVVIYLAREGHTLPKIN